MKPAPGKASRPSSGLVSGSSAEIYRVGPRGRGCAGLRAGRAAWSATRWPGAARELRCGVGGREKACAARSAGVRARGAAGCRAGGAGEIVAEAVRVVR